MTFEYENSHHKNATIIFHTCESHSLSLPIILTCRTSIRDNFVVLNGGQNCACSLKCNCQCFSQIRK